MALGYYFGRCLVWDQPLNASISRSFRLVGLKEAMVQEMVSWNSDITRWNLTFERSPNDQEEDSMCTSLALLPNREVLLTVVMRLFSRLGLLLSIVFVSNIWSLQLDCAAKSMWKFEDFSKGYAQKKPYLSGPSRSSMCQEEEQSMDHFLVHCQWVSSVWNFSLSLSL